MARGRYIGLRKRIGLKLFKSLYDDAVQRHELRTLFWECTLRCNLKCRHCGSDCRTDVLQRDMPLEDFLRVLDEEVTPNVDPSRVLIIFSGGEVLVRPDLEEAGREVTRRGYMWGMVTNGMSLTAQRLQSLVEAGLRTVSVSFDGFEEVHNDIRQSSHSFARARAAIANIRKVKNLAYDVITCVTPAMIDRLEEWKEFLIAEGITNWRIFSIFPAGRAKGDDNLHLNAEQFQRLMEFIRQTRKEARIALNYACEGFLGGYEAEVRDHFYMCNAGISVASIRVNGDISGCTSVRGNYTQGNIYRDHFWEVWQNRFEAFRDRTWTRCDECKECKVWEHCRGGGMHLRDDEGKLMYCHYNMLK
ncbi:MAG: TIGR04133 family radical SAM/SPASM protein [Alistipes sp.]|nr:TIGR04133 family radical SAM/SPASM protein [Alistipes sp.]